jgi:hypothetical protein
MLSDQSQLHGARRILRCTRRPRIGSACPGSGLQTLASHTDSPALRRSLPGPDPTPGVTRPAARDAWEDRSMDDSRAQRHNSMSSMYDNGKRNLFLVNTSVNDQSHHGIAGQSRGRTNNKPGIPNQSDALARRHGRCSPGACRMFGSGLFGRGSVSVGQFLVLLRLTGTELGIAVRSRHFGRWLGRRTPQDSSTY